MLKSTAVLRQIDWLLKLKRVTYTKMSYCKPELWKVEEKHCIVLKPCSMNPKLSVLRENRSYLALLEITFSSIFRALWKNRVAWNKRRIPRPLPVIQDEITSMQNNHIQTQQCCLNRNHTGCSAAKVVAFERFVHWTNEYKLTKKITIVLQSGFNFSQRKKGCSNHHLSCT